MRALPAALAELRGDRCNALAGGCFMIDPARDRPEHPMTVNVGDTFGLIFHPDPNHTHGCCGVGYSGGLANLCCARCGAEVGMVMADGQHAPHSAHLRDHGPVVDDVAGPDDAQVAARIAGLGEIVTPTPWSTEFPAELTGDERWIDDLDTVAPEVPVLRELVVTVDRGAAGTRLILWLDGRGVVPPWPAREVAWICALGRIAPGSVLLPWHSWLPVQVGCEEWRHAALAREGQEAEICAAWWRQVATLRHGEPEQVLAFRVPLTVWERAFADLGRALDAV